MNPVRGRAHRARAWLGLQPNVVVLLATIMVVGMGEELWARFIPKYLEVLGATTWVIALYGTLKDLLDGLYQYPGGWAADHWGRRRSLMAFAAVSIAGYAAYAFAPSWPWLLAGLVLVSAWGSLTLPAMFAIVGDNLPKKSRAVGFGVQALLKRLPIVLAPPLGGALIAGLGLAAGIRAALGLTILLALGAIWMLHRHYRESAPEPDTGTGFHGLWRSMHPGLKRLLVSDILARWAEGIAEVFIVLFVMNRLGFGALTFGWLTSLQMGVSMAVYIPFSKLSDRADRRPLVFLTFVMFALYPLMLAHAASLPWLALAFVVGGLREIGEPARKAVIVDLAAAGARGRTVGLYYLLRGVAVFPAAFVGGWLWQRDPLVTLHTGCWLGLAGCAAYLGLADRRYN